MAPIDVDFAMEALTSIEHQDKNNNKHRSVIIRIYD